MGERTTRRRSEDAVRERLSIIRERQELENIRANALALLAADRHGDRIAIRCAQEMARTNPKWSPIGLDTVTEKGDKVAPGMFYNINFPFSAELLHKMGPVWLTQAFHSAGTLDKQNRVTQVILDQRAITAGNNGAKFLFEVRYADQTPDLHTKLFAKAPYPMTPATKTDRLSSSVYKQPMDFGELNTYRLLESKFPFKIPKFYFGDISNETSNFILICEALQYKELDGVNKEVQLKPYEIEGPYEKCKDYELRGDPKEYYMLLCQQMAKMGAVHKTGKLCSDEVEDRSFKSLSIVASIEDPRAWGVNPSGSTGEDPRTLSKKIESGYRFIADTARALYPQYVTEHTFEQKFTTALMTVSAYRAELNYWKHMHPDYNAMGHQNLNIDNAYFWRDEDGNLDCGVLDWGGFMQSCVGHKLWWLMNCGDFDHIQSNFADYLDTFITTYAGHGGPMLDFERLRKMVIITALENFFQMILAIPNSLKMCSAKEFLTIESFRDPRIAGDIDGKSTLRTTVNVINNGIRVLQEMQGAELLDDWIRDVYVDVFNQPAKTTSMIFGE